MIALARGFNDQVENDQMSYQRVRSLTRDNKNSEKEYEC